MNRSRTRSPSLPNLHRRHSSTDDFTRHIDSITPDEARKQALAAASLAFSKLEPPRVLHRTRSQRNIGTRLTNGGLRRSGLEDISNREKSSKYKIYTSTAAAESTLNIVPPNPSPQSLVSRHLISSSSFKRLRRSRSLFSYSRPLSSIFTLNGAKKSSALGSGSRKENSVSNTASTVYDNGYHALKVDTEPDNPQKAGREAPYASRRSSGIERDRSRHPNNSDIRYSNTPPLVETTSKKTSLGERVRKVSTSWKSRFKSAFGSQSGKQTELPVQHVNSMRRHFGDNVESHENNIPYPPDDMLNLSRLRTSSLNTDYGSSQNGAYSDLQPTSSRVTSWADSAMSVADTRYSFPAQNLASIQESEQPHIDDWQQPRPNEFAAFSQPMRARRSALGLSGNIDTQQVYSALLRRLENYATPDGHITPMHSETASLTQAATEVAISPALMAPPAEQSSQTQARLAELRRSESVISHAASLLRSLTPQQVADLNENVTPNSRRALRPTQSVFFPYSAGPKPKSPSPYQIAKGKASDMKSSRSTLDTFKNSSEQPIRPASDVSASLYSRSTSGGSEVSFQDAYSQVHDQNNVKMVPRPSRRWSLQDIFSRKRVSIRRVSSEDNHIASPTISPRKHRREPSDVLGDWDQDTVRVVSNPLSLTRDYELQNNSYDKRLNSIGHTQSHSHAHESGAESRVLHKPNSFDRGASSRGKLFRSRSTLSLKGDYSKISSMSITHPKEKSLLAEDRGKENREVRVEANMHIQQPFPNNFHLQAAYATSGEPQAFI